MWYPRSVETGLVPDWLIRLALRTGLELERRRRHRVAVEQRATARRTVIKKLKAARVGKEDPLSELLETHRPVPRS